eukprot:g17008.t1
MSPAKQDKILPKTRALRSPCDPRTEWCTTEKTVLSPETFAAFTATPVRKMGMIRRQDFGGTQRCPHCGVYTSPDWLAKPHTGTCPDRPLDKGFLDPNPDATKIQDSPGDAWASQHEFSMKVQGAIAASFSFSFTLRSNHFNIEGTSAEGPGFVDITYRYRDAVHLFRKPDALLVKSKTSVAELSSSVDSSGSGDLNLPSSSFSSLTTTSRSLSSPPSGFE